MTARWTGPFKVLYLVGDNAARLQNIYTGTKESPLVNVNYLKTAHDRRQLFNKYWFSRQTADDRTEAAVNQPPPLAIGDPSHVLGHVPADYPRISSDARPVRPSVSPPPSDRLANPANDTASQTRDTDHNGTAVSENDKPVSNESSNYSSLPIDAYNVERIIRRQKLNRQWHYRVKLHDRDDLIWLKADQLPFPMLHDYNMRMAQQRQQRRHARRSLFGQY